MQLQKEEEADDIDQDVPIEWLQGFRVQERQKEERGSNRDENNYKVFLTCFETCARGRETESLY